MSTGVSGIVYANNNSDAFYATKISFDFEKIANKYGIGSKLGGNVTEEVYNKYAEDNGSYLFLFELMDSPLDNYAEELFEPEMYGESDSENLLSRMKRIESMLKEFLDCNSITQIVLDINYLFGFKENELVIKVSEFAQTIRGQYVENDVNVPAIRIIVKK